MTRAEFVAEITRLARGELGKPYDTHRDCSGFTAWLYREVGTTIPEGSVGQWSAGAPVPASAPWAEGDLLFWDTFDPAPGHVAYYAGKGVVIHAMNPQRGIVESDARANMGGPYMGARRIIPLKVAPNPKPPSGGSDVSENPVVVSPDSLFRLLGDTDRESFRRAICRRQDGAAGDSPLCAEANAIYDALAEYGLTRLGAAMAWIERSNETNPDDLQYYGRDLRNAWAVKASDGRWMRYDSYAQAAQDFAERILTSPAYVGAQTVRQFIEIYAPWSDGNNPADYGTKVADQINRFLPRKEGGPPVPDPIPWRPTIYDLRNDSHASMFGLTPGQRNLILDKCYDNRIKNGKQYRPEMIQLHVQWGMTRGSLQHWLGVEASSTIMVQQDGSILKVIPEEHAPWTGGDIKNPDRAAVGMLNRYGGDPNPYSLTVEAEDNRTTKINDLQLRTIVWQVREWWAKYPQLHDADWLERIVGHYQLNSVDRATCGLYAADVEKGMLEPMPLPDPEPGFPGLPDWMPSAALKAAFPLAAPGGAVTKRVIQWINEEHRIPYFQEKIDIGSKRNLWRFDDVTFLSEGSKVWQEGETP